MKPDTQKGFDWEERFAQLTGARLKPGSGNQWFARMDGEDEVFLWSCKSSDAARLPIAEWMEEVVGAVEGPGGEASCIPGLALRQGAGEYVVIQVDDFLRLMEEGVRYVQQTKSAARKTAAATPQLLRE